MSTAEGIWRRMCKRDSMTYLAAKRLVHLCITLGSVKCLLEEGQKNRYNDDGLERLSKHDEEDRNGEDVFSHVGLKTTLFSWRQ